MTLESFHEQIRLTPKQWERFEEFAKRVLPKNFDAYADDCCGSSPFRWLFRTSGIGTEVRVYCDIKTPPHVPNSVCLTLDDDGEFLHGWGEEV